MNWKKIAEMREGISWGLVASVALHLAFFAAFFLELPDLPKAEKEETVNVQLVPPPEEKKPEPPKPEEKKPEEQAKKEEPAPPPPPPPPEEKKEEQAKTEPPPPPPIPVLRPVFQFGDKNTGPNKANAGNSPQGEAKSTTSAPKPDAAIEPPKPAPPVGEAEAKAKELPARPVPDDVKLPEVATVEAHSEKNAPPTDQQRAATATLQQVKPTSEARAKTDKMDLPAVATLFSETVTDDPVARTLMAGVPRGMRAARLCATELGAQLRHATPSYNLIFAPQAQLPNGTVLTVDDAFGTPKAWYQVRFRCEVDADATRVVSFGYEVGDSIPRSEWRKRGFPRVPTSAGSPQSD